jgi:hypothetical protein
MFLMAVLSPDAGGQLPVSGLCSYAIFDGCLFAKQEQSHVG